MSLPSAAWLDTRYLSRLSLCTTIISTWEQLQQRAEAWWKAPPENSIGKNILALPGWNCRTGKRVGGGVTFAKITRDFGKSMPKKQRRLARDSAILAKLLSNNVVVVDGLKFEKPRTKDFVNVLNNLEDRQKLSGSY